MNTAGVNDGGRPFRVAVAGCGGAAFGIHLPVLAAHPGFEIVAVTDRETTRAEQAATRFGAGRVARDASDLMQGADLLAVLTGVHEPWIEQALTAGVHVFTEKPVSMDVERTRRLRWDATRAGLLLEVATIRAYDGAAGALLHGVPAPSLRGGWLVKADGVDEAARRPFLPPGLDTYTFAADPVQPYPAGLSPAGRRALEILLWQGYHLLTLLILATPHSQPLTCTLDTDGDGVHASVRTPSGGLLSCAVGAAAPGTHIDQAVLTGTTATFAAKFNPPYGPAGPGRVLSCYPDTAPVPVPPNSPAEQMWSAVAQRLTALQRGEGISGGSAELAEQIERLAYGLAYIATTSRAARPTPTPQPREAS